MKNILLLLSLIAGISSFAQKNSPTVIKILTSAQCNMCKERIEKAMAYERGVKESVLDLDSKILTVSYLSNKTTPEKIKKAVAGVGYDADDVPADQKAYEALPPCCKKPEDPDHIPH